MTNMKKRVVIGMAVAGAAVVATTGITAGAAEAGKLPGASKTRSVEGGSVSIRLYDESYRITRAVTNIPTSREVWVSGKVRVTTSGDVKGGNINVGYLIGCQLEFGAGANGGAGAEIKDWKEPKPTPSLGGGAGFTLGPGQAGYVPVINAAVTTSNGDDDVANSFDFGDARGGVAYSQERFGVDECAGYAQGMAKVTVKVSTATFKGNVTMYGKPFSLG